MNPYSKVSAGGLISLLELLRTHAEKFVLHTMHISEAMQGAEPEMWNSPALAYLQIELKDFLEMCERCDLPVTTIAVKSMLLTLEMGFKNDLVAQEVRANFDNTMLAHNLSEMRKRFMDELATKLFFQVPHSRMAHFDDPQKGWKEVISRFPDSVKDVEEMSKCFALSRYSACVFHSLMIVEWGLTDLGQFIGVTDPKPGWDATARKLKDVVEAGRNNMPRSLQGHFAFLEQLKQLVEAMKHAWRNQVNHVSGHLRVVRTGFEPDNAEEIMFATRGFMRVLAEGLPQ